MLAALGWLLMFELLGLVTLPIAGVALSRLPDSGFFFSRVLGLVLWVYLTWLLVSLGFFDYSRELLLATLAILALPGGVLAGRRRFALGRSLIAGLRSRWQQVVFIEVLFVGAYAAYLLFKMQDPRIFGTEKYMDLAFINGIIRSRTFPPIDPWLAGHAINYYYFGHLLVASLTRVLGLRAEVTFNLAIAALFALTFAGVANLVLALAGAIVRRPAGARVGRATLVYVLAVLGALMVAVLGNLAGAAQVLTRSDQIESLTWGPFWHEIGRGFWGGVAHVPLSDQIGGFNWWNPSRIVFDGGRPTINEFPAFSFLLADLHPHVMSLPLVLLALAFALHVVRAEHGGWALFGRGAARWIALVATAVAMGSLYFANSWDYPTYLLILLGAILWRERREGAPAGSWRFWRGPLANGALLVGGGLLAYLPFLLTFHSPGSGVALAGSRTALHSFLLIFAPMLLILAGYLVARVPAMRPRLVLPHLALRAQPRASAVLAGRGGVHQMAAGRGARGHGREARDVHPKTDVPAPMTHGSRSVDPLTIALYVLGGLFLLGVALLLRFAVLAVLSPFIAGAILLLRRRKEEPDHAFLALLVLVASLVLLGCEVIRVRDVFADRMNTIFKFYYQAWLLLSLVAAASLSYVTSRVVAALRGGRASVALKVGVAGWSLIVVALLLGGAVYPVLAVPRKVEGATSRYTLDGMWHLREKSPGDYEALRWLNETVTGSPVILEARGAEYNLEGVHGRVSTFTGLPTILGWAGHESQWHQGEQTILEELSPRARAVDRIYRTDSADEALSLLSRYGVRYLYVGPVERWQYGPQAGQTFQRFADVVYDRDGVTILRLR